VSAPRGAVALRPALAADADLLLVWANDPATRAASFGREPVARPDHIRWLAAVLRDRARRLWIAEEAGAPVGQLRVDRLPDGVGVVAVGLAPDARGRGLGREVLGLGLAAAAAELGIRRARAVVMAANAPSRRLFEGAGFAPVPGAAVPGRPTALVLEADLAATAPDPP
jgi:RimJ/RimL family protein N-acetyltransferase